MVKLKDIATSKFDFYLSLHSIKNTIQQMPLLIRLNVWLILCMMILESLYIVLLILKLKNDFIFDIVSMNFALLESLFIIFLVPFQLYNQEIKKYNQKITNTFQKPLLHFKALLKRSVWPMVTEPLRATLVISFYTILSFLIATVLMVVVSQFSSFDAKKLSLHNLQSTPFYIKLLFVLIFTPTIIRLIQFHFIPFVIFFNQKYIQTKRSALKYAVQASRGVTIQTGCMIFLLALVNNQISGYTLSILEKETSKEIAFVLLSFNSFVRILGVIFISSFLYFLYKKKDEKHFL